MKYRLLLLLSVIISPGTFSQIDLGVPILLKMKDADATGYFNKINQRVILEQQTGKSISRYLYDSAFQLLHSYDSNNEEISLNRTGNGFRFYREITTSHRYLEIYRDQRGLQIWELDFIKGKDEKVFEMNIGDYYPGEKLVAAIPYREKITLVTYAKKANKLLLHDIGFDTFSPDVTEYILPSISLTDSEIKEWGKHLAVNYSKSLSNLYVSDLNDVTKFEISTGDQLFFNDSTIFIVLKTPYNAGFHIVEINRQKEDLVFSNILLNKTRPYYINTSKEKVPTVTAVDSFLIILNNDFETMEYHWYNILTRSLVASYRHDVSQSLIHSDLRQVGTYISRDDEKEIDNTRAFLRKKNEGLPFLKAFSTGDSIVVTFGSYKPTEGIGGTMLSLGTGVAGSMFFSYQVGAFRFAPYLTVTRNKFIFGHSRFSSNTLVPAGKGTVSTQLNKIAEDRKVDDLEKESSFVLEKNGQVVIGIFNRQKGVYELTVY